MPLPAPAGAVTCKDVHFVVPGQNRAILKQVNLYLPPGHSLGLIGLNGAGKTTLARILVGALRPTTGHVRIDGADVWGSDREDIGRYIGYLPQSVSLLPGTVEENVGRFGLLSDTDIVDATRIAGVHDNILKLPQGYDTLIGERGHPLSGGQRQLIGLARAIAGSPSVVVLDEPNSNLDGPAENALLAAIEHLKKAKTTLILISHRPNLVRNLDRIMILRDGIISGSGEAEQMFLRLGRADVVKRLKTDKEA
jgi:ABC-type protease/lipase transport system fused ATPase/permease subunit